MLMTPYERAILSRHPDELGVDAELYLAHPLNIGFLAEYEATWADVIRARRTNRNPSPCLSPSPVSPLSSS